MRRSGQPTCPYSDENFMGPQKGLLGPKRALLGAPGVPIEVPEHMTSMLPTQLDQSVTVGTKLWPWGLLRTSRALRGPLGPPNGPFWVSGGTYMAPEWAKMSYNYVLCTWEVLWGHLRPFMVTSGPQLLLSQWACEQDQKSQFWHPEKFSMRYLAHHFLTLL